MGRISKETFIADFGAPGATLDAGDLDAHTVAALKKGGIAPEELRALSGHDHQINTRDELARLFDLIDRVDRNHRPGSIDTTTRAADGKLSVTTDGAVYEALRAEVERGRASATTPRGQRLLPPPHPWVKVCQKSLAAAAAHGFTDIHLAPVRYFNQAASPYGSHPYPKSPPVPGQDRTVGDAGCAPTGLAMVDAHVGDRGTTPISVADFAVQHRVSGSPDGRGTDTNGLARAWAARHGLPVTFAVGSDQAKNVDVLKSGLLNGGVALVSVGVDRQTGKGHFTNSGHVIVINGCAIKDGQEWFAVANPGRRDQSQPRGDLLTVDADVVQVAGAENGVGHVWISRGQLEKEMKQCIVFDRPANTAAVAAAVETATAAN